MKFTNVCCSILYSVALIVFARAGAAGDIAYNGGDHPEHASAGEVWCLITTPPQFKTVSEEYMCQPASHKCERIPAVYEMQSEQVCCKKEGTRCIDVPAVYKSESYQVEKCGCRTEWQKSDCDKVNMSADEQKSNCMVLVKIPATFETRCRQICVTPATTQTEVIPAKFKTIEKRVCVSAESERRIDFPA